MIFPKTIAQGEAFCNREEERSRLLRNMNNIQHTLVVSPRRYGKTSLILKAIEEKKWPYAHIDLFLAFEENKIIERFLAGIAKLVAQIISINIKAIAKIRDFFKSFSVSLITGNISLGLKLESTQASHSTTIRNAIENLEELLVKYKKSAVFFIDEMQDIVQSNMCSEIEAILRFYAQKTKNLSFIFSGSNRKLLQEIFDDRARPLFKICDRLNLQRIDKVHYHKFLDKLANEQWGKPLEPNCIEQILNFTENHSYYVNYLCAELWKHSRPPTIDHITKCWQDMCDNEANSVVVEIENLTFNQKKLLDYIAHENILTSPSSIEHQHALKLTARGISQSLKGLLEKDIIEKTKLGIRIVDPMLKAVLLR